MGVCVCVCVFVCVCESTVNRGSDTSDWLSTCNAQSHLAPTLSTHSTARPRVTKP